MSLDLSSFEKAITSLEVAIHRAKKTPQDAELRDAVIQRFEYTYELAWKMLKRQLELEAPTPETIDTLSFRDLLREAAEKGIIDNIEHWFIYREQRNITSLSYDEKIAEQIRQTTYNFLPIAKSLLIILTNRPA
ncbi:MAG: nucleotidyltransferase substrate binding protein [Gammaproteobacteria bacterium]|nr:nucleotidyltransferase substrate binding protein [Gammaproteobacteria bacterium]